LAVRPGAYLNPGDAVASVGRLDKVKVVVYVDEPELGRVSQGMPVAITWDARPGQRWQGTVEKTPIEIVALGTRQVGEVVCVIENPRLELLPGTNINAEIRSRVVENALTIPKETLRREGADTGVLLLSAGRVRWRKVSLGVSSVTRAQVLEGLSDGDAVALPTERLLRDGDPIQPIYP
jgi:HlyD family secretion protein